VTESFSRDLESQLAAETDTIGRAVKTDDYERGYEAFFGDEEAEFTGR
jgi:2-(1,2-epoxy-1,2-dihydrophenyl)acetyl-CoA isomerase